MSWPTDDVVRALILIFDRFCYGTIHVAYYVNDVLVFEYDDTGPARGRKAFLFMPRPLPLVEVRIGEVCYTALSDGDYVYEVEVWPKADNVGQRRVFGPKNAKSPRTVVST